MDAVVADGGNLTTLFAAVPGLPRDGHRAGRCARAAAALLARRPREVVAWLQTEAGRATLASLLAGVGNAAVAETLARALGADDGVPLRLPPGGGDWLAGCGVVEGLLER